MEIGKEILRQLGGTNRLSVMIGAHSFSAGDFGEGRQGASFRFKARAKNKAKAIRIFLNGLDLYDIEFLAMRGFDCKIVDKIENVDCENMRGAIEEKIGLRLAL